MLKQHLCNIIILIITMLLTVVVYVFFLALLIALMQYFVKPNRIALLIWIWLSIVASLEIIKTKRITKH